MRTIDVAYLIRLTGMLCPSKCVSPVGTATETTSLGSDAL